VSVGRADGFRVEVDGKFEAISNLGLLLGVELEGETVAVTVGMFLVFSLDGETVGLKVDSRAPGALVWSSNIIEGATRVGATEDAALLLVGAKYVLAFCQK
jgi:hypothetical protein